MTENSDTTTETTEIVKKEENAPVEMSALEELSGQGFDNTAKDDYAIPFLRILKVGSPKVNEDESSYIDGAKAGMFFNRAAYGESFAEAHLTHVHPQENNRWMFLLCVI